MTRKMVTIDRPDGRVLQGYLAEPEMPSGAPGVVVIQEWWGLNRQILGVADRLAEAGFRALVPDLYRGQKTVEQEEANHLMDGLDFTEAASQDVRGALQYLKRGSSRVGCLGFCMGGALTLMAAASQAGIDAAVTFYGFPPRDAIDVRKIHAPLLGHWAIQDQFFPLELVDTLESDLRTAGASIEFHRYMAHHAFANEDAVGDGRIPKTQYDPVWAGRAWDRTFRFLAKHLMR